MSTILFNILCMSASLTVQDMTRTYSLADHLSLYIILLDGWTVCWCYWN